MSHLHVSSDIAIKSNRNGTLTLVLGLLSIISSILAIGFIFGVIGLVFGVIGLRQINRFKLNGREKVVAGIICSSLGIFFSILLSFTTGIMFFS